MVVAVSMTPRVMLLYRCTGMECISTSPLREIEDWLLPSLWLRRIPGILLCTLFIFPCQVSVC